MARKGKGQRAKGKAMDYLHTFNDTITEFMDDLVSILPEDPHVHVYRACIAGILMVDETKLVRGFKKHVSILYGAHILKKDESFLLQHHFSI